MLVLLSLTLTFVLCEKIPYDLLKIIGPFVGISQPRFFCELYLAAYSQCAKLQICKRMI